MDGSRTEFDVLEAAVEAADARLSKIEAELQRLAEAAAALDAPEAASRSEGATPADEVEAIRIARRRRALEQERVEAEAALADALARLRTR